MSAFTVGDLVEPYLRGRLRAGEIVKLTARNDRCALRQFAEACGERLVATVGRGEGRRWLESLDGLAPATRRRRLSAVRGFCAWLLLEGRLQRNPLDGIRSPRQPRLVPRAMPLADVERLIRYCPDARALLVVVWMVQLGLRCREIAAVQLGDIDRVGGFVRITGKGGHERILPLVSVRVQSPARVWRTG